MNGDTSRVNGQPTLNGPQSIKAPSPFDSKISKASAVISAHTSQDKGKAVAYTNGANGALSNGLKTPAQDYHAAPNEILHLVQDEHYLPVATLVGRTAQNCFNDLYELVNQLSNVNIPAQAAEPGRPQAFLAAGNNQTKSNLDKKDRILNFASDQKAVWIKLLVLLQWSKNVRDVSKTISINFWLHEQRRAYNEACIELFQIKAKATTWQTPNPDIHTAGQILSLQRAASLSNLGYHKKRKLHRRQIISTFRRLNNILTTRLALETVLPSCMRRYSIHDGRATFTVPHEFEVDLSVLEEDDTSQYRIVDFRFLSTPRPKISPRVRSEVERLGDDELASGGLSACYQFLHDLTLSNQLSELQRQAVNLARNQWSGNLRIELIRRRLVVQYWTGRNGPKSWLEISVQSPQSAISSNKATNRTMLGYRWYREGKQQTDFKPQQDSSAISLSTILHQVVAQHSSHLLGAMYDRLATEALFSSDELLLDEATSPDTPEECYLRVGVTKDDTITISISTVDGLFVVGSASDRANRLQVELNRSKNIIEEFPIRFSNFRCATAESRMLSNISATSWQNLPTYRPTLAEARSLLGTALNRVSFFTHPVCGDAYLLAIAYKPTGDALFMVQLAPGSTSLADARILHTQELRADASSYFFADLVEYLCGVVVLDGVVRSLKQKKVIVQQPKISAFEAGAKQQLPWLSFQVHTSGQTMSKRDANIAKLRFLGVDTATNHGSLLIRLKCEAAGGIFTKMTDSTSETNIQFLPEDQEVALNLSMLVSDITQVDVMQHIGRLYDLVAAVQFLEQADAVKITQFSLDALQLAYHLNNSEDRSIDLQIPTASSPAQVTFLPADTNPHACLGPAMSQLLNDRQESFVSRLREMVSIVALMDPLLLKLRELQGRGADQLRVHVVVRQPTMLALQYYSVVKAGVNGSTEPGSNRQLLARFEILPLEAGNSSWLLRSAFEELRPQPHPRPAYASDLIRKKVQQELFSKAEKDQGWLGLDTAAGFSVQQPQKILEALHDVMIECAGLDPQAPAENGVGTTSIPQQALPNGNVKQVANAQTQQNSKNGPGPAVPNQPQKPRAQPVKASKVPPGKEVITLDD